MKKILYFSALAILLCFTPAMAREGVYLGGGLLYNIPQSSDFDYLDPAVGLDFKFGYNFGPIAVELNFMGSHHNETSPGFGTADFSGFSLDFRFFLSPYGDPNQFYLLTGLGSYYLNGFDPFATVATSSGAALSPTGQFVDYWGYGFDLGAGLEHYLNPYVSLNFGLIYRFIWYDQAEIGGISYSVNPTLNGDMLSIEFGVNYHF